MEEVEQTNRVDEIKELQVEPEQYEMDIEEHSGLDGRGQGDSREDGVEAIRDGEEQVQEETRWAEEGEEGVRTGENGQEETEGDRGEEQEADIKELHQNETEMEDTGKSGIRIQGRTGAVRKKVKILNIEKVLKRQKEKRGTLKIEYLKGIGAIQEGMEESTD